MPIDETIPRFSISGQSYSYDKSRIAVLGLGNILFSDEGVGVHAAAELGRRLTFSPAIDIIDGGTMGLDLLPFFQDRDRVLIIDAVDFGREPGYSACLHRDAIRTVLNPKLSVHHIGLADLLLATQLTRSQPIELYLVGIQPYSLAVGIGLTSVIRQEINHLLEMAVKQLDEWNVTPSERDQPKDYIVTESDISVLPRSFL